MNFLMISSIISINTTSSLKRKLLENDTNVNISGIFDCKSNLSFYNSHVSKHNPLSFPNDTELIYKNFNKKKCDKVDVNIDEDLYCVGNCSVYEERLHDSKEIFDWLDQIDIQERSRDELNKCSPVKMDRETLRVLLSLQRHKNFDQTKYEINELKEKQYKYKNSCSGHHDKDNKNEHTKSLDDYQDSSTDSCEEQNLIRTVNTIDSDKKKFSDEFKAFIFKFIDTNIGQCYKKSYFERIKSLEETYNIFDKHKLDQERYNSIFETVSDEKLVLQLRNITVSFDKNLEFNQETCDKFTEEFDDKIFKNDEGLHLLCCIDVLSYEQKVIFFYLEFFKLYKYIVDIPELLTLGRLFSNESCQRLIFILHLINLFADNISNLKVNRIIICCMIYKAFKIFNLKNSFDLFLISNYDLVCNKTRHNMNYFLWEINARKRRDIKYRKMNVCALKSNDINFLKAVFYVFLYQNLTFFELICNNSKSYKSFKRFIDKVKKSKNCFGCLFNEYLENRYEDDNKI